MSFPKIDGYVVTEKLGSGSYSTVYKAYTKVGARSVVAVKCVEKCRIKHSGSAVDNLITEIRLLKTLRHTHIVHMHNFTWDDRYIYIIMEYCCGGDLSKYIHKYGRIPEHRVLYFLQQLASALKFLREKGVVHMDLKPHNLLLHKDSHGKYILKLADFGLAAHLRDCPASGVRGSPLYMAPEMLHCSHHDGRVDLWSVGVIMYECLFGRAPYSSGTFKELLHKIETRAPILIPSSPQISEGCRDLLTRLLKHDPDERISYEQFFAHHYLDLEHMPTNENYEKAVSLMKRAIELDCGGQLSEALRLYTESLRYLVPLARGQTQPTHRAALHAKLTRYMERAEEIKQYLKQGDSTTSAPNCSTGTNVNTSTYPSTSSSTSTNTNSSSKASTNVPRSSITSCCRGQIVNTMNSYDFSNMRNKCASERETEEVNGTVEGPAVSDEVQSPSPANNDVIPKQSRLRRLLSRGMSPLPSLPPLHTDDDNNEDPNQKDGCRIT